MDAYSAMAHIVSVRPQRRGGMPGSVVREALSTGDLDRLAQVLGSAAPDEDWAERWHHIRAGWAQTTFFLFDPQSWR
jgi:hypothetical protein